MILAGFAPPRITWSKRCARARTPLYGLFGTLLMSCFLIPAR